MPHLGTLFVRASQHIAPGIATWEVGLKARSSPFSMFKQAAHGLLHNPIVLVGLGFNCSSCSPTGVLAKLTPPCLTYPSWRCS